MRKKNFFLQKNSKIIIYGAGERGMSLKEKLIERKFNVIGYFDQRKELKRDIPVYSLEYFDILDKDKSNIVVMISLSNGALHKKICKSLYYRGFFKLVFLPINYPSDFKIVKDMLNFYERITNGYEIDNRELATYSTFENLKFSVESSIIKEIGDEVVVWMNYQIIYSLNSKEWKLDKNKILSDQWYHDKNIGMFLSYIVLMRCFNGDYENYGFYLRQFNNEKEITDLTKKLEEREKLFRIYKKELNFGMDFFKLSAPSMERNAKGYFNLLDGHHRIIFLYIINYIFFPVKIKKKDFKVWVNQQKLDKVIEYINKFKINELIAPLPHPAFINFPAKKEFTGKTILAAIFEELSYMDLREVSVLDCSGYQGYFARNFRPMVLGKVCCIDNDMELTRLLNELMTIENIDLNTMVEVGFSQNGEYDIIFMMDSLSNIKDTQLRVDYIKTLNRITKKKLFWESTTDSIQVEINEMLQYTDFLKYKKIHSYFMKGKFIEVGCFSYE